MANKETMETVTHLILGSKINVVGSKINDIKRCLLLGRKAMANLNSILKSRDIILLTNVHIVKAMISPVVMYGCERWIIKEAEHWRTDASKLWCWRRFLRVPWTARRSNQSILKKINPEYSLEGLMLKLWYFGHLKQRARSWCWERLKEGGEWDTEDELVGWHCLFNGHEFEQIWGNSEGQGSLACCYPWGCKELDINEQLNSNICIYIHIHTCVCMCVCVYITRNTSHVFQNSTEICF